MPKTPDYFAGKTVIITGAASGIGRATANIFAREGANVVCADLNEAGVKETAAQVNAKGSQALALKVDVTKRPQVDDLVKRALDAFGTVHFLFNSAGATIRRAKFLEIDDELMEKTFNLNVKGTLYGMQAVLPHLQARGDGTIANVSSMLGRVPFAPIRAAYSACKAAMNSLTETMRMELKDSHPGIRVITVLPGVVKTDFGSRALGGGPDSRSLPGAQEVDEVARVIADALLTRNGDVYTRPGAERIVLGHLEALAKS